MMIRLFFIAALALTVAARLSAKDQFVLDFVVCTSATLLILTLAALHRTRIEFHQLAQPCMPQRVPVVVRA